MKIACIGEAMIELSLDTAQSNKYQAQVGFAGDTLNTAIYLKRSLLEFGNQVEVAYITVLGKDSFSELLLAQMQSELLSTEHVLRSEKRVPGLYAITTDASGERSFTYWRERSAARLLFDQSIGPSFSQLEQYDALYFSAITLAILPENTRKLFFSYLKKFKQLKGKWIAFDSNYRPTLWSSVDKAQATVSKAWSLCDIALPSVDDEIALFNDTDESSVLSRLKQYGITRGALKRGANGPVCLAGTTSDVQFEPVTNVVDSTAAGDSFNGGYLASLILNNTPQSALLAGHQCASRVIQHKGAIVDRNIW